MSQLSFSDVDTGQVQEDHARDFPRKDGFTGASRLND